MARKAKARDIAFKYFKGPLGWGVTANGLIIGLIRKTRDGYQVAVTGFKPLTDGRPLGSHLFKTLEEAKAACEEYALCR